MNQNTQREINLLNTRNRQKIKMNHHFARGLRFEMEVLGAFYASPLYITEESVRLITGERGYCDGIFWTGETINGQFKKNQKVSEIEIKLRSTIGKEPRQALIETLQEKHVKSFLEYNLRKDPSNYKRILVVGFTTTLDDQRSKGVCSYDQYGLVAVVYFNKHRDRFQQYTFKQAICFYDSFHEFNEELYRCTDLDEYFDLLSGDAALQYYFTLLNEKRYNDLIMAIFSKMSEMDFTGQQQINLVKILQHQLQIGINNYFTNLSKVLNVRQPIQGRFHEFFDKGWIERSGKKYIVNFEKIIRGCFQKHVNPRSLLDEAGIDFSNTY